MNSISIKIRNTLSLLLVALLAYVPTAHLLATAEGRTGSLVQYEDCFWKRFGFSKNGSNISVLMPQLQDGIEHEEAYPAVFELELTVLNERYEPYMFNIYCLDFERPKSNEAFAAVIQEANSNLTVTPIDPALYGADFAIELTPIKLSYLQSFIYNQSNDHWRFFIKGNSIIHLGTTESNESRRTFLFESVRFDQTDL